MVSQIKGRVNIVFGSRVRRRSLKPKRNDVKRLEKTA
jgi:hypothetical protein